MFDSLSILVNEIGWVRGKDYKVKVISVVKPKDLILYELDTDGSVKVNGEQLKVDFSMFYQGDRIEV